MRMLAIEAATSELCLCVCASSSVSVPQSYDGCDLPLTRSWTHALSLPHVHMPHVRESVSLANRLRRDGPTPRAWMSGQKGPIVASRAVRCRVRGWVSAECKRWAAREP
eukprot:2348098-Prymnesium_polylepis.2